MPIAALTPFFSEMRKELTQTTSDLERWIAALSSSASDDPLSIEAMESFLSQIERIGLTAEMIGMHGLKVWCISFSGILPDVILLEGDARQQACKHLAIWPELVDEYLQEPAEFASSLALVKYLSSSCFPQSLDENAGLNLVEALTVQPVVPEELLAELAKSVAPVNVSVADTSLLVPETADPDVYNAFIDEAPGNAEEFSALTTKIAAGRADINDIRTAKRIAHSFKGSANIVGIRGIAALGHQIEDVLEYFEKNPVKPPKALGKSLVIASDCLAQMVGYLRGDESAPGNSLAVLNQIVAWVNKVKTGEIANMDADADAYTSVELSVPETNGERPNAATAPVAESEVQTTLRVPIRTVDEIYRLVGEMTAKIARLETQASNVNDRTQALLSHNILVRQRVLDIEKLVMLHGLSLIHAESKEDESFDPLELDRYNELHGYTRSLVEVTADAREMTDNLESSVTNLRNEVEQQTNINKELQYQITATRMAPVSVLSARLVRNVRQTCLQTGKQAELVITGGEIQVDGDVLNKLADPLLHLLRNAVDHGIELPEERVAAGKPAEGIINLNFSRQGSGIVVAIKDDGKGLDFNRIRSKATELNLISAEQELTRQELARLVLLPGFSTREQVSEISGRGVGMDVVASRLLDLKGTVELASEPGHGCEIMLRFQASLVTQHTLLVEAGQQLFAIPIHYIKEAVPGGLGQISKLSNTEWQITLRDEPFRIRELTPLTGYPSTPPSYERYAAMPKVLIHTQDGVVAVLVDRVTASSSVMVKTMGKYLARVHGVSGVTFLGDGTIVPLLNLPELLAAPIAISTAAAELAAAARLKTRRIIVVEDSLSVRKALMQLLHDAAFEVKGAGDGMEAIREIESFKPHLVCTDLEMPNMNGLELTQHLRLEEPTRHLPVIMITSRSMDKHREQAMRAGVDIYVTKPYTDAELLQHVRNALQPGFVRAEVAAE